MSDGYGWRWRRATAGRSGRAAVLLCVALVLTLPLLLHGANGSDSSRYNYVWVSQFDALVRGGQLYPRWLPRSFEGLGSPTFVFYPPAAFFLCALLDLVTFNLLPVPQLLGLATLVLLWLSGLAMARWLAGLVRPPVALGTAVLYMCGPYHLTDVFWRGALAESSVFVALPLVLGSLDRAARGWAGCRNLAVWFGLLVLCHLPTALLASTTVLPAYAVFAVWRTGPLRARMAGLVRCGAGLMLGLALVALYLLPALRLQPAISAWQMWRPSYRPERWLLTHPASWPSPTLMVMLASFAAAIALACLGCASVAARSAIATRHTVFLWVGLGLACVLLMAGAVPGFWSVVPFVAKIQFPWRILVLAEFCTLTAFALVIDAGGGRKLAPTMLANLSAASLGLTILAMHALPSIADAQAYWQRFQPHADTHMPDASEYLPAGFLSSLIGEDAAPELHGLPAAGVVTCAPLASACRIGNASGTKRIVVEIDSDVATQVDVGQFYFPGWRASIVGGAELALQPRPPFQTIGFAAPAGAYRVVLQMRPTAAERVGGGISAVAAVLLLASTAWGVLSGRGCVPARLPRCRPGPRPRGAAWADRPQHPS